MKTILITSASRGHADYGWLDTRYTFSFADYRDPDRVHFGALRVINDDVVLGGGGFDRHPHDNMEITTVVLEGRLEHKDSMGHTQQIGADEVQVMTAGTGIFHSEYNADDQVPVKLFQIWIFPQTRNLRPRYDQKAFDPAERKGNWQRLVSPDEDGALQLNQKAWMSRVLLAPGESIKYDQHLPGSGFWVMMISGTADVEGTKLETRDGLGIWESSSASIQAQTAADILLIEVPMQW